MKSESDSEPGRQASGSLQLTGSKISQRIEFYRLTGLSTEKPTHRHVSRQIVLQLPRLCIGRYRECTC